MDRIRSFTRSLHVLLLALIAVSGGMVGGRPLVQAERPFIGEHAMMSREERFTPAADVSAPVGSQGDAAAPDIESPPSYFYSSAAIPPGLFRTTIAQRFIRPTSLIFLTVDATAWPGSLTRLPALKVQTRGNGFFVVGTADRTAALSTGVPFNYVVFNVASQGIYTAGRATMPAGSRTLQVTHSAAIANSRILLTLDNTDIASVALPALKIANHGKGFFVVSTLDGSAAPSTGIPFSYLIVNDTTCLLACGARVAAGTNTSLITQAAIRRPTGVFLTVDATSLAGNPALPGVKVESRGAGFFRVYTSRLDNAPATGLPFNWFAFYPPSRWEEFGPTARSGNVWTVAVPPKSSDPNGWKTQYIGSSWGGVWKTTDGGDTWALAWDQPVAGITNLVMAPDNPKALYALARDGYVYATNDAGNRWTKFTSPIPNWGSTSDTSTTGGYLATPGTGALVVCSDRGLYVITLLSDWQRFGPDPVGDGRAYRCTDIVAARDGSYYAAFRDIGVWRLPRNGSWKQIHPGNPNDPIRVAVGTNRVVLNVACLISTNSLSNITTLTGTALFNSWLLRPLSASEPHICRKDPTGYGQGGYAMSIAISPTNDNHFIAFGDIGYVTFNGGQTWRPNATDDPNYRCDVPPSRCSNLRVAVDDHQTLVWDDSTVFLATDFGSRYSRDGGLNWREALTNRQGTDGPPVQEYSNLSVSLLDQFSRAYVVGNAQDIGAVGMIGRTNGFYSFAGEHGLSEIAPRSLSLAGKSVFRSYGSYGGDPKTLDACDFVVTGPAYEPGSGIESDPTAVDVLPLPAHCFKDDGGSITFPAEITTLAASNALSDTLLVGLADGTLYRARPGTSARRYDPLPATGVSSRVSTIYFNSDTSAFVGFENGQMRRITNPFSIKATMVSLAAPHAGKRITSFASPYGSGSSSELYVTYTDSVWRSSNLGASWVNVTGSSGLLPDNLATGVEIVGLVRDPANPHLYLATGHRGIRIGLGGFWKGFSPFNQTTATVFQAHVPVDGTWTTFGDGLPVGMPITGIGISPDNALYLSSQGRGVWWRRDVAALPPSSGVNRPETGSSPVGAPQVFVTTCSYTGGWQSIHTLEFKLAVGHGPQDGEPAAFWLRYDQEANLIQLYDPSSGTWSEGAPGSNGVLSNEFVDVHLAQTTVRGGDLDPNTVQITWAVVFREAARGQELQQYLRVTDDKGHQTGWDKVGTWQVDGQNPLYLPLVHD